MAAPARFRPRTRFLALAGCALAPAAWLACGRGAAQEIAAGQEIAVAPGSSLEETESFAVPPPPFSEGAFPCSECHEPGLPVNSKRRPLRMAHEEIVLSHDEEHRWCLDCHDAQDRDQLHLASGALVPFTESYRLCGQCHGDKYRDWRVGVHGRRTGEWNGRKEYLLCVHCHNSHAPAFQPLAPEPAPPRPERTP